jgi:hypothetical protein
LARTLIMLVLGSLVLAACAGTSGAPSAALEARTVVRLYDAGSRLRLELANESHPELQDVYSRRRPDASLKLAPDELIGDLVRDLERLEFAALSSQGGPPDEASLRGWVQIESDGVERTFAVPSEAPSAEELQAFAYMKLVFNEYYSHVGGLQYIQNPQGGDLFRRQR